MAHRIRVTPARPIRVQATGTAPACAYCRERVAVDAACSRCGAATCAGCRSDYAPARRCPTLGCPGDDAPAPAPASVPGSVVPRELHPAARTAGAVLAGVGFTLAILAVGFLTLLGIVVVLASSARVVLLLGCAVALWLAFAGRSSLLGGDRRRD